MFIAIHKRPINVTANTWCKLLNPTCQEYIQPNIIIIIIPERSECRSFHIDRFETHTDLHIIWYQSRASFFFSRFSFFHLKYIFRLRWVFSFMSLWTDEDTHSSSHARSLDGAISTSRTDLWIILHYYLNIYIYICLLLVRESELAIVNVCYMYSSFSISLVKSLITFRYTEYLYEAKKNIFYLR